MVLVGLGAGSKGYENGEGGKLGGHAENELSRITLRFFNRRDPNGMPSILKLMPRAFATHARQITLHAGKGWNFRFAG